MSSLPWRRCRYGPACSLVNQQQRGSWYGKGQAIAGGFSPIEI